MTRDEHLARAEALIASADEGVAVANAGDPSRHQTGILRVTEMVRNFAALASAHMQMAAALSAIERERLDDELRDEFRQSMAATTPPPSRSRR